jgi:xanthine/uracil permease
MGAIGKIIAPVLVTLVVLIGLYLAAVGIASWKQGYSWTELDWNQDGSTSIEEFFMASDIGKRTITKDNKPCTEYFSFKDGFPIKTECLQSQ